MDTTSHWMASAALPKFPSLTRDLEVDVAVVGAGITGVSTAYLLKRAGFTVALLERGRCGQVDTGHTTAHLTNVTDLRLHQLISRFGKEAARAVWDAGAAALDRIFDSLRAENIEADFQWVPGYLHAVDAGDDDELRREAAAAAELGVLAHHVPAVPFFETPGVKFANQAMFHPLKFLAGMVAAIPGKGSAVYENTEVGEISEKPLRIKTPHGSVTCGRLVLATHNPLMGNTGLISATLLQTKLCLYTSYALGARVPRGIIPNALFWDTADPYHYLRVYSQADGDYAIYGGEDHKTGQTADTVAAYQRLEDYFKKKVPAAEVNRRWSGQVIETNDGLPFIGETADRQFVATGFAGNGITFGTLGALMAVDWALGRKNPWADLFDPHRKKLLGGTWRYLVENKDYPYYFLRDRLARAEGASVEDVGREEGKIIALNGHKVAAYRDARGKITLCSPVCTHMQGIVKWNEAERTWDCPCHGARFQPTGEVISGPAEKPLEKLPASGPRARKRKIARRRHRRVEPGARVK